MSAELPVDPAMVNARVTVIIETDATATSPATRTTVTMPHVTQVHATPVEREHVWDRDYSRPLDTPPPGIASMVLGFDLARGAVEEQVRMHTERMVAVSGVGFAGRVAEPYVVTLDPGDIATCRHCQKRIVRPANGVWYHRDVAGPRVCE